MATTINSQQNLVFGKVTDGIDRSLRNLKVDINDVGLREQLIP